MEALLQAAMPISRNLATEIHDAVPAPPSQTSQTAAATRQGARRIMGGAYSSISVPEAWAYYVVADIDGERLPLAAMHRIGDHCNLLEDVCSVSGVFAAAEHREAVACEKELARGYYRGLTGRPRPVDLRDFRRELRPGAMPMWAPPRDVVTEGRREFPYTSACLYEGITQDVTSKSRQHRQAEHGGKKERIWTPLPLEAVKRLDNRSYALMVWDITDLDNVRYGITFPESGDDGWGSGGSNPGSEVSSENGAAAERTALGQTWYPMSVAELMEYAGPAGAEQRLAAHRVMRINKAGPEVLRYICNARTPLPQSPAPSPWLSSLVDQAITSLVRSAHTTTMNLSQSTLTSARELPGFKPALRRALERAEMRGDTASPAVGHLLAAAFEGEHDIDLTSIKGISAEALRIAVESEASHAARSITLVPGNMSSTVEELVEVLVESGLEARIFRKPEKENEQDAGFALYTSLVQRDGFGTRVFCAAASCSDLELDLP